MLAVHKVRWYVLVHSTFFCCLFGVQRLFLVEYGTSQKPHRLLLKSSKVSYLTTWAICKSFPTGHRQPINWRLLIYRSHIHDVQQNLFSAFNPPLRSSGQPQRSARGPASDSTPVLLSRVLTGNKPNVCCFDGGGNRSTRRKPAQTRGEHANST